jgi:hypothetical protein
MQTSSSAGAFARLGTRTIYAGVPRPRDGGRRQPAIARIEKGTRDLKLEKAIAFAQVLDTPFAHLLEPARDELISLTDSIGTDGDGIRRWLTSGVPIRLWPAQMRTRQDRELAAAYLLDLAWAIVNTAIAGDAEDRKHAERQFADAKKRLRAVLAEDS